MAPALVAIGVGAAYAEAIAAVATVVTTAVSVAGTIASSQAQAKTQKRNAALMDKQARDRAIAGQMAAEKRRRTNRLMIAEQTAGMAESGMLSGTSLDLLDQNSVALEMDALTVAYNAEIGASHDRAAANNLRADAKATMAGGYMSAVGAGVKGLSSISYSGGTTSTPKVGTLLDPLNV